MADPPLSRPCPLCYLLFKNPLRSATFAISCSNILSVPLATARYFRPFSIGFTSSFSRSWISRAAWIPPA